MGSTSVMTDFEQRAAAITCATRAALRDAGLNRDQECALQAAGQAVMTAGVLVRVGCGSLREFVEQLDLVNRALFGFLENPRQLPRWMAAYHPSSVDERHRMRSEGFTFELQNGSGVLVFFDVELAADRSSPGTDAHNTSRKDRE